MRFAPVAQTREQSTARILIVALRAHGFHPLDLRDGGLPGVPNLFGPGGYTIEVPEDEVGDATVLVNDLLRDMEKPSP